MVRTMLPLFTRAARWRYWSLAIDGANELGNRALTEFIPFVDTSEIVEYVLPSSVLADHFPTRLDLSLSLLFLHEGGLFVFGPHATEMNGVREGWGERMHLVSIELKLLRERHEKSSEARKVERDLEVLSRDNLKQHAGELVRLLRDNHRWIFAAWRIPVYLDRVLQRLHVPSPAELDLPDHWTYRMNRKRVNEWLERLDRTERGRNEPGPNLIDAYALDQLEQTATNTPRRLPILFTHSVKILEALRQAREEDPDCLRVDGISLVQPPYVALVLRLKEDVQSADALSELGKELERQRERCERIAEFVEDIKHADGEGHAQPDYSGLEKELKELEDVTEKWDALQKVRQTIDPEIHSRVPLVDGLERILASTPEGDKTFENALKGELDNLIQQVDRLQEQIAARSPLEPKAALEVDLTVGGEATASVRPDILNRARNEPAVPSAAYPTGSYRFRDALIIPYVTKIADIVTELRAAQTVSEERESLTRASRLFSEVKGLANRPEYFLLMAVVCLAQEKWLEASATTEHGLRLLTTDSSLDIGREVESELLLTRGGAIRAHVLASRVDVPSVCQDFLRSAVENCLTLLEIQQRQEPDLPPDPRCVRELAVIFGSAREPVFGLGKIWHPIDITIRPSRLREWVRVDDAADTLAIGAALARRAYELGSEEEALRPFFLNTHLYAMTETDRLLVAAHKRARHSDERIAAAQELERGVSRNDPNFLDTLMWHYHVLATEQRQTGGPWQTHKAHAEDVARQLDPRKLEQNRFYQRLVLAHKRIVLPPRRRRHRSPAGTARRRARQ